LTRSQAHKLPELIISNTYLSEAQLLNWPSCNKLGSERKLAELG
jgi:hypothetical protein